jgi:prevent-host-death family protein
MASIEIGIRELKTHLSRYLARVRRGDEVVVTARGIAVARLIPAASGGVLEALIADGLVEPAPAAERRPPARPRVRLRGRGPSMAGYVVRQRR